VKEQLIKAIKKDTITEKQKELDFIATHIELLQIRANAFCGYKI